MLNLLRKSRVKNIWRALGQGFREVSTMPLSPPSVSNGVVFEESKEQGEGYREVILIIRGKY